MSVRTLKRDIEFMKDRLKMPIAFAVPKNGYFFTKPQPHFPTACRQTLEPRAICGLRSRSYVLGAVGVPLLSVSIFLIRNCPPPEFV